MKFSELWLREWADPAVGTEELAHMLTMAGLEVDAIEPVAGEFANVVVGLVKELAPHPDADKLKVCKVDVAQGELLQIVCGASNVAEGMKAPVAMVGASLPGGLKIKKAKLRGVESSGMLCSSQELGLAESAAGLMALPSDAPVGTDLREYLHLDDHTIELGLTPNRGDCLSVAGIAREVAVLSRSPLHAKAVEPIGAAIERTFPVSIAVPQDCPHYVGRVIEGIDTSAVTPMWMQEALRRSGIRSLGPVVDVTNYILLELGQPMHAFDLNKLTGYVVVRHALQAERLELLDGQAIELQEGTMVIADETGPQALAGIMGGAYSAVSDATDTIFLESAFFNPLSVAGRARSYGLHTDSSHRFERGVDPALQRQAIERATSLLLDIVGGKAGPIVEVRDDDCLPRREAITLRRARIERVLGASIADEDVVDILHRLGMAPTSTPEGWSAVPPSFRFDLEIEVDLIEELARVYGYSKLPSTRPEAAMNMQPQPEAKVGLPRLRQILVDRGYQEVVTYSFVEPGLQKILDPEQDAIRLANPISEDMSVMRTSLWPGLVQALSYNLNRQQNRVRFFESGLKFVRQGNEIKQERYIAGLISGELYPEQWSTQARAVDFYDLKGDVESLLSMLSAAAEVRFVPDACPALHPGQAARIMLGDEIIGWLGAMHPEIERRIGLNQRGFLFELRQSCFESARLPKFAGLSRFPSVRRDLAVIVSKTLTATELETVVREAASGLLKNFHLFDVYTGEGIDSGRKSVAFGLTFQDHARTLEDADIEGELKPILSALTEKLGATLRE